jgi:hypothetical protein
MHAGSGRYLRANARVEAKPIPKELGFVLGRPSSILAAAAPAPYDTVTR